MCASSSAEQLSSTLSKAPKNTLTSVLNLSLSLIATISCGNSFQRWEAVSKNVLLWSAVFGDGCATAAVW